MKSMKQICNKLAMVLLMFVVVATMGVSIADCAEIQPSYIGIVSVKPAVTANTSNTIVCSDTVLVKSGYTAKVTWTAQHQNEKTWTPDSTWSAANKPTMTLNKTLAIVHGRTYRLQTVVVVYNSSGNVVETITKVSDSIRV